MRALGFGALGAVIGAVVGYSSAIILYIVMIELTGRVDRDGGGAMNFAFVIGPALALLCAITGAIALIALDRSRQARRATGALPPAPPWTSGHRRVLAAIGTGFATYAVLWFVDFVVRPGSFSSYAVALLVGWLPTILALAAGIGVYLELGRRGADRR